MGYQSFPCINVVEKENPTSRLTGKLKCGNKYDLKMLIEKNFRDKGMN